MKRCREVCAKLSVFLFTFSFLPIFTRFSQEALEDYALKKGFGYKTANLMILNEVTKEVNRKLARAGLAGLTTKIPKFKGISSSEVKSFLLARGFDIDKSWQSFQETKNEVISNKNSLTPKALEVLERMRTKIVDLFSSEDNFFGKNEKGQGSLYEFLDSVRKGDEKPLVMIRSTGREDTETVTNAGGNESVISEPSMVDASVGMGVVVGSYCGRKSLEQRLAAARTRKDIDAIFDEKPFIPILFQVVVGERVGAVDIESGDVSSFVAGTKKIPVSGVMFTQEAEGRTPGVTHIQAAYGHGELVVNGMGATDSFYIGPSKIVHKVIGKKTHRLVPAELTEEGKRAGKQHLISVKSHPALVNASSLHDNLILGLKVVADAIEDYFEAPRDIEFVVEKDKRVINIVQSRPIVHKKDLKGPSYIENIGDVRNPTHRGTVIGAGGGSLRKVFSTNEYMIENDLAGALDKYLKDVNKEKIKCVIIGKNAPATSHEATTFRGQGVPVIYVPDIERIKKLTPSGNNPVFIDVQRGMVVQADNVVEKQGWFSHPIPAKLSLYKPLRNFSEFEAGLSQKKTDHLKNIKIGELFEVIKQGTSKKQQNAYEALAEIYKRIVKYTVKNKDTLPKDLKDELRLIISNVVLSSYEIMEAIKKTKSPRLLSVLYAVNFLEALLFQQRDPEVLRAYSYGITIKTSFEEGAVGALLKKEGVVINEEKKEYILSLLRLVELALTDSVAQKWVAFVAHKLSKESLSTIQEFSYKVVNLKKLGSLGLWLNHDFMEYGKTVLENFNQNYEASEKFLNELQNKIEIIDSIDVSKFKNPENFSKLFLKEFRNFAYSFTSRSFIESYKSTSKLGKKSALMTMYKLVEVFDHLIKTVTGTQDYGLDAKLNNFRTMLKSFWSLLKSWLTKFDVSFKWYPSKKDEEKHIKDPKTWIKNQENTYWEIANRSVYPASFKTYRCDEIYKIEKQDEFFVYNKKIKFGRGSNYKLEPPNQVLRERERRARFNASLISLGASGATVMTIVTLEEFFTVVHQSILNIISNLMQQLNIDAIAKPSVVEKLHNKIRAVKGRRKELSLVGIFPGENFLKMLYNAHLTAHNALVAIEYRKKKGIFLADKFQKKDSCIISVVFSGDPSYNRWKEIAKFASSFSDKLKLKKVFDLSLSKEEVIFSWDVIDQPDEVLDLIVKMIFAAVQSTFSDEPDEVLERWLLQATKAY